MLVARVGPEVRVVRLSLSEVVIDDRAKKRQRHHQDGKAHRPHTDKHAIHIKKSIAVASERDALGFVTGLEGKDCFDGAFQFRLIPFYLLHVGIQPINSLIQLGFQPLKPIINVVESSIDLREPVINVVKSPVVNEPCHQDGSGNDAHYRWEL